MKFFLNSLLIIWLIPFFASAQLSGSYTIGGISPNYTTITAAVQALNSNGVSGPVVFNIRSGVYDEEIIWNGANGVSKVNTVTFQSELLDSSTVTVTHTIPTGNTFYLQGDFIILKELTITNPKTNAIVSYAGTDFEIDNCFINDTVLGANAIEMNYGRIRNCRIEGNIIISLQLSDSIVLLENNIIIGNVNSNGCKIDFENNTVSIGYLNFTYHTCIIKNNKIINGWFMAVAYDSSSQIINNEIQVDRNGFSLAYSPNSQVIGNKFYSESDFSYSDSSVFVNNFFYNNAQIFSNYCTVKFNNMAPNPNLYMGIGYYSDIENNIFSSECYCDPYNNVVNNNDYMFSGGMYDSHPFHINPKYKSLTDIHSTNQQLKGKGLVDAAINYDIDSTFRPNPPSMGANEICISADTLNVYCGDSTTLSLCSMPANGSFTWSPPNGLNNVHLANPILSPNTSSWYSVADTSGYIDSVFVNVIPLSNTSEDTVKIPCGDSTVIYGRYNAGATYHWYPATDVSDSTSYFTMVKPSNNETFIVAETVPGCGTFYDTVNVYHIPYLSVTVYDTCLTLTFMDSTICATSYFWNFGDSTYSTATSPVHTYSSPGTYFVYMVAYNAYGNDTITGNIMVDTCSTVSVSEVTAYKTTISPNPFSVYSQITFSNELSDAVFTLYNVFGQKVRTQEHINGREIRIDRGDLPSGIYIYDVVEKDGRIGNGKLMVE